VKTLYSCSSDDPPEYKTDPAAEPIAELKHTITRADLENFDTRIRKGKKIYHVKYTREISMGTKQGTLLFKVLHDGKEWGSSEIEYDGGENQVEA
jgi:hypothetical protein